MFVFYTYSLCHFYHNFYQKLNRKKIEITFPIFLLCTNKQPTQPTQQTQMAMTNEQLTKMVEALTKRVEELEEELEEALIEVWDRDEHAPTAVWAEEEPADPILVDPHSVHGMGLTKYANSVRAEVRDKLVADVGSGTWEATSLALGPVVDGMVFKAIAAKWKELGDEERAVWNEKAKTPPASEDEDAYMV